MIRTGTVPCDRAREFVTPSASARGNWKWLSLATSEGGCRLWTGLSIINIWVPHGIIGINMMSNYNHGACTHKSTHFSFFTQNAVHIFSIRTWTKILHWTALCTGKHHAFYSTLLHVGPYDIQSYRSVFTNLLNGDYSSLTVRPGLFYLGNFSFIENIH